MPFSFHLSHDGTFEGTTPCVGEKVFDPYSLTTCLAPLLSVEIFFPSSPGASPTKAVTPPSKRHKISFSSVVPDPRHVETRFFPPSLPLFLYIYFNNTQFFFLGLVGRDFSLPALLSSDSRVLSKNGFPLFLFLFCCTPSLFPFF